MMKAFSVKGLAAFLSSCIALLALASWATSPSFAQAPSESTDGRFHDDLLDHFVGKWAVNSTVYGRKFTLDRDAEWVMNHQYLRVHEKSHEALPRLNVPFERTFFIGYNRPSKRYVVYELSVHGIDNPNDPPGFAYAERSGNELKIVFRNGSEVVGVGRNIWDPASHSWQNEGRQVVAGKEQDPFLVGKATRR